MKLVTKTITIRVDEKTKLQAEAILEDIGLNMTVLFNACLKAVIREKRVPFALASSEHEMQQMIRMKLLESEAAASDPTIKRYTHSEIFGPLREHYGYEI